LLDTEGFGDLTKLSAALLEVFRSLGFDFVNPILNGSLDVPDKSLGEFRFCHYSIPPKKQLGAFAHDAGALASGT